MKMPPIHLLLVIALSLLATPAHSQATPASIREVAITIDDCLRAMPAT